MPISLSTEDDEAFRKILEADPECRKCFECDTAHPQWCDVLHGTFICIDCSGIHRSLGVHLSFVRSSTMDSWSDWKPEKLRQMAIGGNRRARLYFEKHNVPKTPLNERYMSLAALRYAAMLEAEALGEPFNEAAWKPPEWYARARAQPQQAPYTSIPAPQQHRKFGEHPQFSNQGMGKDWFSTLSDGWNTVSGKTVALAQTATESLPDTLSTFSSSVAGYASKFTEEAKKFTVNLMKEDDDGRGEAYYSVNGSHPYNEMEREQNEYFPSPSPPSGSQWGKTVDVHPISSPSIDSSKVLPSRVVKAPSKPPKVDDDWNW